MQDGLSRGERKAENVGEDIWLTQGMGRGVLGGYLNFGRSVLGGSEAEPHDLQALQD